MAACRSDHQRLLHGGALAADREIDHHDAIRHAGGNVAERHERLEAVGADRNIVGILGRGEPRAVIDELTTIELHDRDRVGVAVDRRDDRDRRARRGTARRNAHPVDCRVRVHVLRIGSARGGHRRAEPESASGSHPLRMPRQRARSHHRLVKRSFRTPFVRSQWSLNVNVPLIDRGSAYDSRDSWA
jgi:hypothetical protein